MQANEVMQKVRNENFDGLEFFGEMKNGQLQPEGFLGQQALIDEVPLGIYLMNKDGTLHSFNKMAEKAWGRTPNLQEKYCGSYKLFYPHGEVMPHDVAPPVTVLKNHATVRNIDVVCEQPNGTRLMAKADIFPIKNKQGDLVGAVNFFRHNPNKTVPALRPSMMAHIAVADAPGIVGPMKSYPETAKPLNELAEKLLVRETSTFSKAERETVAAYVSYLNQCVFCSESHSAVADYHWKNPGFSKKVWENLENAPVSDRLRSLLRIAAKVQKAAGTVTKEDVNRALQLGATESDVHDTVLIAAAFCMYNRYVDGLATFAPPRGDAAYQEIGKGLGEGGYINAIN